MHKAKAILNAFYEQISTLKGSVILDVVKTNINTEQTFPMISVTMGPDTKQEFTKELYQHELTVFTDIYVRANENDVDDQMLDIRELIELKVLSMDKLDLDYVFKIDFQGQDAPDYNGEGTDYSSRTRLEWLIEYFSEHQNPSN